MERNGSAKELEMEFEKIDNTIEVRNLQLVIYEGKILTMEEYMRAIMLKNMRKDMDKKIRSIGKKVKKDASQEEKQLKQLEKMDKKRDKVCELGKEMLKKRKKK